MGDETTTPTPRRLGDAPTLHADPGERSSLGAMATMIAAEGVAPGELSGAATIAAGVAPAPGPAAEFLARGTSVGRYVVLDRLGAGGMGVVYAAYDPELDRKVALKLLQVGRRGAGELEARLRQEAQAMARLSHANVVTVHDVGAHRGQIFLAMEMIDGATLREWLAAAPRSWQEIVAIFVQAGRGLAAAHAAGLVHRDFKPDNVLCTRDGRACVADFGLARASGGKTAPASHVHSDMSSKTASLTRTGAMMGTPAYMAPEQHLGEAVGPAADIFAFCVALFEALYGLHPFGGESFIEIQVNVLEGAIREPPRTSKAPLRLARVITQGLALRPEERPQTMDGLLGAIDGATRPRRRWLAVEGVVVAAAVVAGSWGLSDRRDAPVPVDPAARCVAADRALDGTWGEAREAELRRAFAGSGLVYAGDVADRVVARLDAYGERWSRARRETCLAHHVGGELSARHLERASACLEHQRRRLDRLIALLGEADEDAVKEAIVVVDDLDPPERCQGDAMIAVDEGVAVDPALAERRESIDAAIEDARAWTRARRYDAAIAQMATLVAGLERFGDTSERARAMIAWSEALYFRDRPAATRLALDAVALCWRARDDRCVVSAVTEALSNLVVEVGDASLADHLFALGLATVARLGGDLRLEARVRYHYGIAIRRSGEYERGLEALREALALYRRVGDRLQIARAAKHVGIGYERLGRYDAAAEHLREAVMILSEEYGADHPDTANSLGGLGVLSFRFGDYETAADLMTRQLAAERKLYGARSKQVADVHSNIAIVSLYRGDLPRAEASIRETLAIEGELGDLGDVFRAQTLANLAEIHRRGGDLRGARAEIEEALALLGGALPEGHPDFITANSIAGHVARQRGDLKAAGGHYERAMALVKANALDQNPSYVDLWLGRADLALRRGRPGEAKAILADVQAVLDRELHHRCDRAILRFLEARILAAEGDEDAAITRARESLELYDSVLPGTQRERDEVAAWLAARVPRTAPSAK